MASKTGVAFSLQNYGMNAAKVCHFAINPLFGAG